MFSSRIKDSPVTCNSCGMGNIRGLSIAREVLAFINKIHKRIATIPGRSNLKAGIIFIKIIF
jgi:hypothetical protein